MEKKHIFMTVGATLAFLAVAAIIIIYLVIPAKKGEENWNVCEGLLYSNLSSELLSFEEKVDSFLVILDKEDYSKVQDYFELKALLHESEENISSLLADMQSRKVDTTEIKAGFTTILLGLDELSTTMKVRKPNFESTSFSSADLYPLQCQLVNYAACLPRDSITLTRNVKELKAEINSLHESARGGFEDLAVGDYSNFHLKFHLFEVSCQEFMKVITKDSIDETEVLDGFWNVIAAGNVMVPDYVCSCDSASQINTFKLNLFYWKNVDLHIGN